MRKIFTLVLFIVSCNIVIGQNNWKKEGMTFPYPICYGSGESHPSHIGPPKEFYERLKSASVQKANIEVTYVGFPPDAQKAFQYAVDIWKTLISSSVTIRVKANWISLAKGVLGSCGPTVYYKNFNSTQKWNCYYPVAVVEKMLGEEVNGADQFDIDASFNKDFSNWYFGTDGNTPHIQYDFVSVILHELTHGLGFTGLLYTGSGSGAYSYGLDKSPGIYDKFVTDQFGEKLVDTLQFVNPSVGLNLALASGWLDFDTKLADGQLPRLYAPAKWDTGSSIYHLDDSTYPAGDANSLMTPFTGTGEAIHDPGPYALAIMNEIGWKTVAIRHSPIKDIEYVSGPIDFNAIIEGDYGLDSSKVFLVYSTNRFVTSDSIRLKSTDIPANFAAQLSNLKNGELDYFFSATDKINRRFVLPATSPTRFFSFNIGTDKIPPVVTHNPVKFMLSTNLSAKINANVTDNIGVKSVTLEYFVNSGLINELILLNDSADRYTVNLFFPEGTLTDGDKVSYRIVAVDASSQSNVATSPLKGYYSFYMLGIQQPVDKYVNNFNTETHDFIGSDFTVFKPAGFDSPGLNSAHPYLSPEKDNMEFNFITKLKYPIILKAGGQMSYDEIVLVEPGDPGTKFGDANFYDYVIVEGSKDGKTNWKPLIDGYDSNAQKSWLDLYNSSIVGQNSTTVATKDLFVKRTFGLLANGNFNAGDIIQIRFRLFSDPYANGWGWIIDNLSIQDVGTGVNSLAISSGEVIFFPNPASGNLNFQLQTKNKIEKLILKAYNSSGIMVYNQQYAIGSNSFQTEIDVRNLSPDLYLFTVEPENGKTITRKIIIR